LSGFIRATEQLNVLDEHLSTSGILSDQCPGGTGFEYKPG